MYVSKGILKSYNQSEYFIMHPNWPAGTVAQRPD